MLEDKLPTQFLEILADLRQGRFFYKQESKPQSKGIIQGQIWQLVDLKIEHEKTLNQYRFPGTKNAFILGESTWDDIILCLSEGHEEKHRINNHDPSLLLEFLDNEVMALLEQSFTPRISEEFIYQEFLEIIHTCISVSALFNPTPNNCAAVIELARRGFFLAGWIGEFPDKGSYAVVPLYESNQSRFRKLL